MSGSGALRRLTVLYLRGAVGRFALDFEAGRTLTIIYGENGTGKSTICDAFDLLGSGGVGSLADRGLGRTNDYWASFGKSSGAIAVTIEASDGTCHAVVQRNEVVTTGSPRPRVMVLRRAQILSVVQATDADRYKAIQRFIDVSAVEACEVSLLAAVKEINKTLDAAASRIEEQRESIRNYWTTAGSPGRDALAWAKQEVARDVSASAAEIVALENVRAHYERLRDASAQIAAATRASTDASTALVIARDAHDAAVKAATANASDLVNLLEAAKRQLAHDPAPAACPLCDSPDRAHGLAARVDERLSAFTTLRDTRIALDADQIAADRAAERLTAALGEATRRAKEFDEARASSSWPDGVPLPASPVPAEAAQWTGWLASHDHLAGEWRKASAARESANTFLDALGRAWKTYASNLADQTELSALRPRMQRAHEVVLEERKRFTDDVLAEIAAEVGRMYEAVHPGEGLDRISLALDPKRRASLTIGSSFLGAGSVPPAAYLSESHLDTLGLCVFLALAGREAPGETVLVLDDPLGSVDAPHADRAIEMLYDEVARFRHCVITTHFKPWREKYRWGRLKAGDCQFAELTKWTPSSGLTLVGTMPELERLRSLLRDPQPDVQSICAKAGVVLEAALDFLTIQYRCAVPRNAEGRYTLGDLLPAVNGKLLKALVVETLGVSDDGAKVYTSHALGPHLDALNKIVHARNLFGCHFNEVSHDLLDCDGLAFGQQVLALMELLTDDGSWPKHDKSGTHWATRGETRRLHPLKKPS